MEIQLYNVYEDEKLILNDAKPEHDLESDKETGKDILLCRQRRSVVWEI